jgi:hypothetical protein
MSHKQSLQMFRGNQAKIEFFGILFGDKELYSKPSAKNVRVRSKAIRGLPDEFLLILAFLFIYYFPAVEFDDRWC